MAPPMARQKHDGHALAHDSLSMVIGEPGRNGLARNRLLLDGAGLGAGQ